MSEDMTIEQAEELVRTLKVKKEADLKAARQKEAEEREKIIRGEVGPIAAGVAVKVEDLLELAGLSSASHITKDEKGSLITFDCWDAEKVPSEKKREMTFCLWGTHSYSGYQLNVNEKGDWSSLRCDRRKDNTYNLDRAAKYIANNIVEKRKAEMRQEAIDANRAPSKRLHGEFEALSHRISATEDKDKPVRISFGMPVLMTEDDARTVLAILQKAYS